VTPKRIVRIRKALGLTQQDLAEKIGAFRESVSRWESGKNEPRGANLKALLDLEKAIKKKK
jgi:transcriptional regulator with XRE-family HTH domain